MNVLIDRLVAGLSATAALHDVDEPLRRGRRQASRVMETAAQDAVLVDDAVSPPWRSLLRWQYQTSPTTLWGSL